MTWPADMFGIILAVVLGGVIGLERELSGKVAGMRTNIMICLGAAIFTVVSRQLGLGSDDSTTRISAQIVSGVGFLGAGAIIQDRGGIFGLTTAATIWLVAAVGMACGAHYFALAAVTTGTGILVLVGLRRVENMLRRAREQKHGTDSQRQQ